MNETGRATCCRRANPTLSCRSAAGHAAPPGSAVAPAGCESRHPAAPPRRPAAVGRGARAPAQRRFCGASLWAAAAPEPPGRRVLRTALGGRGRSSPGARRTGGCPPAHRPVHRESPSPAAAFPLSRLASRLTGAERSAAGSAAPRPQTAGYLCRGLRAMLAPAAGGGGRGSPRPPPRPAAGLRPGAPPPRTGVPRSRGRRRRKQVEIKE